MSGLPAPGLPASKGLLTTLRSWLGMWAGESDVSPASLRFEAAALPSQAEVSARVLVVDDNPVNLMVMSSQLESRGIVTTLAGDGAEAVALASEFRFDLILMDLQMPVLDGLGATSAIRRFERESSCQPVPVVAYSSASPGERVLALHGLNAILGKPCSDRELEHCLLRWCPAYASAAAAPYVARSPPHPDGLQGHVLSPHERQRHGFGT